MKSNLAIWSCSQPTINNKARLNEGDAKMNRKVRENLTAEEKARLEKYGAIEFKSAGAVRKR